ncbi:MAG: hypothetical protein J7493_06590 [Porphyrobacter sp.]|nr:hypothetical protein [Porphyrobacter sp.]
MALSACNSETPETEDTTSVPAAEVLPSPDPALAASPDSEIPEALRGRWGLVPADCEPGRDDAKGLLTITETKLEFYESVGTLEGIEEFDPSRIRASFNFTGEGQEWERDVVLDAQDQGKTLIRREYGEDAAPGPFRYTKCS